MDHGGNHGLLQREVLLLRGRVALVADQMVPVCTTWAAGISFLIPGSDARRWLGGRVPDEIGDFLPRPALMV